MGKLMDSDSTLHLLGSRSVAYGDVCTVHYVCTLLRASAVSTWKKRHRERKIRSGALQAFGSWIRCGVVPFKVRASDFYGALFQSEETWAVMLRPCVRVW